MANENKIEAEVRLDHRAVDTGVAGITTQMGKMDQAVAASTARIEGELQKALKDLGGIARQVDFNTLAVQLNTLSNSDLFKGLSSGVSSFLGDTARVGSSFQAEFAQVKTLLGDLDTTRLEAMSEGLRTLGRELNLGVTPTEAAAGAYAVLQNGFEDAADAQLVLTNALKTGVAGRASDMNNAINLVTGTLNAFNLKAGESAALGDKIFTAIEKGGADLTVDVLSNSLGRVSGTAYQAGISIDEMFAVLATATAKGQQTGNVISGLSGIINAIQKPTEDAKKEFAALGVQVDAASLKQKGLLKTLQELNTALAKRGTAGSLSRIAGDVEARNLLGNLTGENFSKFEDNIRAQSNSAGRQQKVLETVSATSEQAYKRMTAAGERLKASIQSGLEPAMIALGDTAAKLFDGLERIPGPIKTIGVVLAGATLAAGTFATAAVAVAGAVLAANSQLVASGIRLPIFGRFANQAARDLVKFKAETAAAAGIQTGFRASLATALSGVSAYTIALAGIGVAAVGAGLYIQQLMNQVEDADRQFAQSSRGQSENFGEWRDKIVELRPQDARDLSVETLADIGASGKDLRFEAQQQRLQLDNQPVEKRKKALEEIEELEKKAKALDDLIAKRSEASDPAKLARLDEDQKKVARERYQDELRAIELSDAGHKQKIEQLNALLSRYRDDADKRDSLERKIYDEKRKLHEEEKKQAAEVLKQRLQEVDNSRDPEEKKILKLRKLLKVYEDQGDARRAIEDRIFKHETELNKKREDAIKRLANLKDQAAQDEQQRSQKRQDELERLSGRGVDTFDAQVDELAAQGREETRQVDAKLEADLSKEKDPKVRAELKRQAEGRKQDIQADFDRRGEDLLRADKNQRLSNEQELLQQEQQVANLRINLIKNQLATSQYAQSAYKQAILERLALEEREIQLQAELAKARTEDPRQAQLAEALAQGKILEARKRAREEIESTTQALQEQKKAKESLSGSKEFRGGILSLEEFIKGESERFADKQSIKPKQQLGLPQLVNVERQLLWDTRVKKADELSGFSKQAQVQETKVRTEIVLLDKSGKEMPFEVRRVTVNGKNSDDYTKSRGLAWGSP